MRTVMVRDSNGSAMVPPVDLAQPPLEKSALGVIGDQRERSRVALRRFRRGSDAAQQVGARGMEQVIAVEVAGGGQRLDEGERRAGAVHHGDRRRAVQGDDGGGLQALEHIVQPDDLRPVRDRKSTRLNSSHGYISYAVFCLKKKKQT